MNEDELLGHLSDYTEESLSSFKGKRLTEEVEKEVNEALQKAFGHLRDNFEGWLHDKA